MARKKKKEIEIVIDDAGTGNFVGGILIAGYSQEINFYKGIIISPEVFNTCNSNSIQLKITKAVKQILAELKQYKIKSIFLCQSALFDNAAENLIDNDYVVFRGKVEGPLQDLIEKVL